MTVYYDNFLETRYHSLLEDNLPYSGRICVNVYLENIAESDFCLSMWSSKYLHVKITSKCNISIHIVNQINLVKIDCLFFVPGFRKRFVTETPTCNCSPAAVVFLQIFARNICYQHFCSKYVSTSPKSGPATKHTDPHVESK